MNFADNWARVFVVITFLTFGEAQIIGGIVPNLIAFGLFLGAIGYFAATGKMAEMFGLKNKKWVISQWGLEEMLQGMMEKLQALEGGRVLDI